MHQTSAIALLLLALHVTTVTAARASFSVHYPWATRAPFSSDIRGGLLGHLPFCGDIIRNPQRFSAYTTTFVSFSGNVGDLVTVHYTRNRVPRSPADFKSLIVADVPIAPSGQLCFNITMPRPASIPEYGVLLFQARDPVSGQISSICSDIKLADEEATGATHPAMCARNNETLIPMPDDYLKA